MTKKQLDSDTHNGRVLLSVIVLTLGCFIASVILAIVIGWQW